jgi:heptosyltransferase I
MSLIKGAQPEKILIILFGAIGDVTRGLSLVCRIKRELPATKIYWVVEKTSSKLIEDHPSVDKALVFNKQDSFFSFLLFLKKIRALDCDVTLDLSRHLKGGISSFISGSSIRVGFNKCNSREGNWLFQTQYIEPVPHFTDKIDHFHKFGDAIGLPPSDEVDFGLTPRGEEISDLEKRLNDLCTEKGVHIPSVSKRVLFLIGSTWKSREWPSAHFAEFAHLLYSKFGMTSFLVGSPSDATKASEILSHAQDTSYMVDLTGFTSLRELVILCHIAKCGIGADSGPMHIASAVGLPVISFWGPTSPERSTPYGNKDRVLQSPIGCSPCYFRECPGLDTLCLKNITPAVVEYKFEEFLKVKGMD